ncbi:hypothetical protein RugamoR64_58450 [Duganella rhizosphaerae]
MGMVWSSGASITSSPGAACAVVSDRAAKVSASRDGTGFGMGTFRVRQGKSIIDAGRVAARPRVTIE